MVVGQRLAGRPPPPHSPSAAGGPREAASSRGVLAPARAGVATKARNRFMAAAVCAGSSRHGAHALVVAQPLP